jgi:hypothetical protein
MSYSTTFTVIVPANLYGVACAISKALDFDTGGADSFGPEREDATEYTTYATPCTEEFMQQAIYMINNPEVLHKVVTVDYATRWINLEVPTLSDCKLFCKKAKLLVNGEAVN